MVVGILCLILLIWQLASKQYVLISLLVLTPLSAFYFIHAYMERKRRISLQKWLDELNNGLFLVSPVTAYAFRKCCHMGDIRYQFEAHVRLPDRTHLEKTYEMDYWYGFNEVKDTGTSDIERNMLLYSTLDGKYRRLVVI